MKDTKPNNVNEKTVKDKTVKDKIVDNIDNKIVEQKCSKCGIMKSPDRIVKNRKICKDCCNKKKYDKLKGNIDKIDETVNKTCSNCNIIKNITLFSRKGCSNICIDCSNLKRRTKYDNSEEMRKKAVQDSTEFKKKRKAIKDEVKKTETEKLEKEIGQNNTICKYCKKVKPKTRFRHNRLKCKDCERDDPDFILQKRTRSRIHSCLIKNRRTHEYLGCSRKEYIKWLENNNDGFTLKNYGTWHIDHVIPLSRFNLKNEEEILLAFNWRNTTPLLAKKNLSKNNKILIPQIKEHFKKLKKYHKDNNMIMPQKFIKLYAKHLEAGTPLELKLPPVTRNCKQGTRLIAEPNGNNV
jgi:hypothetical protein